MKELELIAVILKITMYLMVIGLSVYLFDTYYESQQPVECIHWDGFTERYKIESKQRLTSGGVEYYLDAHGQVVLQRPLTEAAKKSMTEKVN